MSALTSRSEERVNEGAGIKPSRALSVERGDTSCEEVKPRQIKKCNHVGNLFIYGYKVFLKRLCKEAIYLHVYLKIFFSSCEPGA